MKDRKIEDQKTYPEARDLLGKSAVMFSVFATQSLPLKSAESLHAAVGKKLQNIAFYSKVVSDEELNELLLKNSRLAQAKEIYLDSLTVVAVSDKDISNPLGNYLNVDNFLVFQLDQWPCQGCTNNKGIRMKLRLVDAKSSYIIWTGIAEKRKLNEEESANLEATAVDLAEELADHFNNRFKKKWHHKRFSNLAKSVG